MYVGSPSHTSPSIYSLPQLSPAPYPVAPLSSTGPSQPLQRGRGDCVLLSENKPTLKKEQLIFRALDKHKKYLSSKKKKRSERKKRLREL